MGVDLVRVVENLQGPVVENLQGPHLHMADPAEHPQGLPELPLPDPVPPLLRGHPTLRPRGGGPKSATIGPRGRNRRRRRHVEFSVIGPRGTSASERTSTFHRGSSTSCTLPETIWAWWGRLARGATPTYFATPTEDIPAGKKLENFPAGTPTPRCPGWRGSEASTPRGSPGPDPPLRPARLRLQRLDDGQLVDPLPEHCFEVIPAS